MDLRQAKGVLGGALLSFSALSAFSSSNLISVTGLLVGTLVVADCLTYSMR